MILIRIALVACFCMGFTSCFYSQKKTSPQVETYANIVTQGQVQLQQVTQLFPQTPTDIDKYLHYYESYVERRIAEVVKLAPHERTFDSVVRAYDDARETVSYLNTIMRLLSTVSEQPEMRAAAQRAWKRVGMKNIDWFFQEQWFEWFTQCWHQQRDQLSTQERYYLKDFLRRFRDSGLHLPHEQQEQVRALMAEITELTIAFRTAISYDSSQLLVTAEELKGVSNHFKEGLQRDGDHYVLRCTYPASSVIMSSCAVSATRKKFYQAFNNRAYPKNMAILEQLIAKRQELARLVGYKTYADYSLAGEMLAEPQRVEQLLQTVIAKVKPFYEEQIKEISKDVPEDVRKNKDGKLEKWDQMYLLSQYKRRHLAQNNAKLSSYFPLPKVVDGMLTIFSRVFDISCKRVELQGLWTADALTIEVRDKTLSRVNGYIVIDAYPRPKKYPRAYHAAIVHSQRRKDCASGKVYEVPAVSVLVINLPKPCGNKPSLLRLHNVKTLFHEFGHAIHSLMGNTEMARHAGTSVSRDHSEMPSQLFESWAFHPTTIPMISGHYKTGEPLSQQDVESITKAHLGGAASWTLQRCWRALVSLRLYQGDDLARCPQDLWEEIYTDVSYPEDTHFVASFQHLDGYAARYYAYLWSKIVAVDFFDTIQRGDILDPAMGKRLVNSVLGRGGSADANELVYDFLGRAPKLDAFFAMMGFA